ncbi:DNA gyrase subunit A [Alkalicaulis satelles]|uniref:DNA gyrase subunit A n=2 Tax=Alkalicaulis satelles TaxID=2609175 RepID=A0A5M6ZL04_9PROT|nr:DNA gyrase subunit A [Alkalicaulis satelles]
MHQGPSGPAGGPTIAIEDEMKRSYLDYAMSVIVSRAIPDARDGLKPVHRRILWSMHEQGYTHDKQYRKSARVVGDVIGKYHPHGDSAVYDALARMAQDFSMGLVLLDGQGNFGSVDGDPPAAMRYTEIRMDKPAEALLADIDKETVDFRDNYDGSEHEPVVLPARYPNLLVNGAGGIAVGMATNIPPHNLGEIADATLALLDNPALPDADLLDIVPGPDFPTGGEILGRSGARKALMEGRGSVLVRGKTSIETIRKDREAIIIHEIPYQVNKATMIEKIAELVREKRIEGISDLRDESDRSGMRVVVELKKDANAEVILNQMFRWSPLQQSFGVNMLALIGGRPQQAGLRTFLETFIDFRKDVTARRAKFDLRKARERAHILIGLAVAVANIDEIIRLIRAAPDPASAREQLRERAWPAADVASLVALVADPRSVILDDNTIRLTEEQARAILDLRLNRLTALGRDEISDEAEKLAVQIADLLDILKSPVRIREIIRDELTAARDAFAVPRRTQFAEGDLEIEDEDLIPREEMVVTLTHGGYVKRTALSTYRAQNRGGRGRAGMAMKDEDFVATLFVASTHAPLLFFSSDGMVYKTKTWRLPLGAPNSRGKYLTNLLPSLNEGAWITSVMALPEDEESWDQYDVMFATTEGTVRRNKLSDFVQVNRNGKIAMKLEEAGSRILDVRLCREGQDVLLVTASGKAIRFPVGDVRVFASRNSTGVRGIRMGKGDSLISMAILNGIEISRAETRAYIKRRRAEMRSEGEEALEVEETADDAAEEGGEDAGEDITLSDVRYMELFANEEMLLTVAASGMGKRVIAYEYFTQGRGGQGVWTKDKRFPEPLAGCFPVTEGDTVMAVTDGGQLIRFPVDSVRIAARATKGVRLIRLGEGEKLVSVVRVAESGEDEGDDEAGDESPGAGPAPGEG